MKKNTLLNLFLILAFLLISQQLVTAQPNIHINSNHLDFGEVVLTSTSQYHVMIINNGNEPLIISAITFSSDDLQTEDINLTVNPLSYAHILVSFTPSELGVFEETMFVESNSPSMPVAEGLITANVGIPTVEYLVARYGSETVELSWGSDGTDGTWLSYDNGNASSLINAFGFGRFYIASKWLSSDLAGMQGEFLSRVSFFAVGEFSAFNIRILTGENGETLLYEGIADQIIYNQWNEYHLETPVEIEAGNDYWIAMEITQTSDFYASVGFDTSPSVDGLGNLIFNNGQWTPASEFGFNANWMIRGFFGTQPDNSIVFNTVDPVVSRASNVPQRDISLVSNPEIGHIFNKDLLKNALNNLVGFNIYRDGVLLNAMPVNTSTFVDNNVPPGTYTYGVTIVFNDFESEPVEREVQVGAPRLVIDPVVSFFDDLAGDEVITQTISFTNTGFSELEWSSDSLPGWLELSEMSGTILAAEMQELTLTMDVNDLNAGKNFHTFTITTNNGNKPVYRFFVEVFVIGQQVLSMSGTSFDFGRVAIGTVNSVQIDFVNISDDIVYITGFSYQPYDDFTSYTNMSVMYPGTTGRIIMGFWPSFVGIAEGEVSLSYISNSGAGTLKFPMSGEGFILQPSNLGVSLDEEQEQVNLSWLTPGEKPNEIYYGSGIYSRSMPTSGPGSFEAAIRFDASDLIFYNDRELESVAVRVSLGDAESIIVHVYVDENGNDPIMSLPIDEPEPLSWNTVTLPATLRLDTLDHLWLGFEIGMDQGNEYFVAVADNGPAVAGKGDLFRIGSVGWNTLSASGISRNWGIKGILSDEESSITFHNTDHRNNLPSNFLGYRVYRDGVLLNDALVHDNIYTDTISLGQGGEFNYGVSAVFSFGESEPLEALISLPVTMSMPDGWDFDRTSVIHNIHIPEDLAQIGVQLDAGDMLGVFFVDDNGIERAAGAVLWNNEHTILTVFGNDDDDTDAKNGPSVDEELLWRVYQHQEGTTSAIDVAYDHNMPHYDGTFKKMGLSMIYFVASEIQTSSNNLPANKEIIVYPNPSSGQFAINGITPNTLVRIFDSSGRLIRTENSDVNFMLMQIDYPGIYVIEGISESGELFRIRQVIY